MLSSRPRVRLSPRAMYCRRISTGRAPFHQHRAKIPDERSEHVAGLERVGGAHRIRLLTERTEQPAQDLGLPIKGHQALFERAGKPHEPVQLEQLIARQAVWERGSGWSGGGHANPEGVAGKLTGAREWANAERGKRRGRGR